METDTGTDQSTSTSTNIDGRVLDGVEAVYMSVVSLFGFVGNILILTLILRNKTLRNSSNILVANLSLVELLVTCTEPFHVVAIAANGWPLPAAVCEVVAFLSITGILCSIVNLTIIAVNRYVLVARSSDDYHRLFSDRNTGRVAGLTWVYTVSFVGVSQAAGMTTGFYELPRKCIVLGNSSTANVNFVKVWVGQIAVLSALSAVFYAKTYLYVRRRRQEQTCDVIIKRQREREEKLTKTLFVIFVLFFLTWLLSTLIVGLHMVSSVSVPSEILRLGSMLYSTNVVINPFLYGWKNQNLRAAARSMMRKNAVESVNT
ncbi:hypothetical protein Bbelb_160130 [Branchiostoma belcheri]|nr:hypothetical protein Bbelb_160130 [Branchiostoma belcheri]